MALEKNALNLKIDVYASLFVAAGLIIIKATGLNILDPILGWIIALIIIREAWVFSTSAFHPLLDSSFSPQEKKTINVVLEKHKAHIIDYHRLRTWKIANIRHLDFYIAIREEISAAMVQERLEIITRELEQALPNSSINIHIDPGSEN